MKVRAAVFHKSIHLDASQLENPENGCLFCGSTNRHPLSVLQKDPEVLLLECGNCCAASASRMPTEPALAAYYERYYQSALLSESANRITFDRVSRFGKYLARMYSSYQSESEVSILDFGGGDGAISHATATELLNNGINKVDITVVDYNEEVVSPHDSRISITREKTLENVSFQYDFIIASAIIEHIPKPRPVLDTCFGLMKQGGLFYARTPFMVPIMRVCSHLGIKLDLTYPAHVHDLGQHFWESYLGSTGAFRMLQSKPSIVETTCREHFLKTLAAYSLKAPWYLLGKQYKLVGGWEVLAQKN